MYEEMSCDKSYFPDFIFILVCEEPLQNALLLFLCGQINRKVTMDGGIGGEAMVGSSTIPAAFSLSNIGHRKTSFTITSEVTPDHKPRI